MDAKEKEIKNLVENDVFESVQNESQPTILSRWIITEKFRDGKKIVKARLAARRECLRLVFTVAGTISWDITSTDITAAFLQGGAIEREVYLKSPADVCSNETVAFKKVHLWPE